MVMGGAERVVLNIARSVDSKYFSFHLVTTEPADNVWYDKFQPHFQNIVVIPRKRAVSGSICNKYLRQLIRKLDIDIVLNSNSEAGYKYLPRLKSEFKNVITMDILHVETNLGATDGLTWVTPYLDRRICISSHLKQYMVQKYKDSGIGDKYNKRLKVIYNGFDVAEYRSSARMKGKFKQRYGISADTRIFSFMARFAWGKNPLLFIDIAKQVITRSPDYKVKFVMAGDGPRKEFDKIRYAIDEYGIQNYIVQAGRVDSTAELLADTYILLVTSREEGIPFTILESMAMGTPAICTNIGAMYEVIKNNINGVLINPKSNVAESFTKKIRELLLRRQIYKTLSEKARKTVTSKYSLEIMGGEYQNVFQELLKTTRIKVHT